MNTGRCWLCDFAGSPEANSMAKFCVDNAGTMAPAQMAVVLHDTLQEVAPGQPGTGPMDCLAHITTHSLQPTVQFAIILRNLLSLVDKLGQTLINTDDDGNMIVDAKNVQTYIKVIAEVKDAYKTGGGSKLMFEDTERLKASQPLVTKSTDV